jgi:hypothetical protein
MRSSIPIVVIALTIGCFNEQPTATPQKTMSTSLAEHESDKADAIYIIDGADAPWGDYGNILIHGMSNHLGRRGGDDGPIQLERTGPFVPPITFQGSGHILVTDEMKHQMEQAGFRGITFRPVEKAHIANVEWHEWDLDAEEPEYYPEGGEPEGYILNEPHSAKLAASIGTIWEVVLSDSAQVTRHTDPTSHETTFSYVEGSWNGNDLFSVAENYYKYTSARAKAWFEQHAGMWVSFQTAMDH